MAAVRAKSNSTQGKGPVNSLSLSLSLSLEPSPRYIISRPPKSSASIFLQAKSFLHYLLEIPTTLFCKYLSFFFEYNLVNRTLQSLLYLASSYIPSKFSSLSLSFSLKHSKPMATAEDHGGSSVSKSFRGLSLLSSHRNQVVSMEQGKEQELRELDLFHSHVAGLLLSLPPPDSPNHSLEKPPSPLLSLAFLSKLLDALLAVEAEFLPLFLFGHRHPAAAASRPVADLLDRAVKFLDLCNAVSLSLHSLQHWLRHAYIAASALLPHRPLLASAHLLRARRALSKLLHSDVAAGLRTERARSFDPREANSRSLSWIVSRNWSAHLAAPRNGEGAVGGLAAAVYTMNAVLGFAMWALVAALQCQEGQVPPVAPPRQLPWATAMVGLQERIAEDWRRRDRKAAVGLLAELQEVERCGRGLMEVLEAASSGYADLGGGGALLERERAEVVAERAAELAEACRRLEEGLGPLQRQVREVFHRVVGSRAEVLRSFDQSAGSAASPSAVVS